MNTAMMADYLMIKKSLGQQVFVGVVCGLIIGLACGDVNILPAIVALMITIGQFISLSTLDERNGWEAYRSSLPLSRSQIISGRMLFMAILALAFLALGVVVAVLVGLVAPYLKDVFFLSAATVTLDASGLAIAAIGSLAALLALLGVFFPVIAKFGMTKAVRILPLVFVMIFLLVFVFTGGTGGALFGGLDALLGQLPLAVAGVLLIGAGVAVYACGGVLAMRFYQQREF